IFDPLSRSFRFSTSSTETGAENDQTFIAESIPSDGDTDAPIENPIALRFTKMLDMTTVNRSTLVLRGPGEIPIEAIVTPAEHGRLAFVLPITPLQPGTTYVLRIHGVFDSSGTEMPGASITVQTAGAPPDPAGLDWVPNSTWTSNGNITRFQELPAL